MKQCEIDFLAEFITESDAIEEIENDALELRLKISNGATRGRVGALLFLRALARVRGMRINEEVVLNTHALITAEQGKKGGPRIHPQDIGSYRRCYVAVGERPVGPPPEEVSAYMKSHIGAICSWQAAHRTYSFERNVRTIADFHLEFLEIHPFVDGNGRTSRALAYCLLRIAGIQPFVFTSADKHETYYRCFDVGMGKEAMQEYFLERVGR